MTTATEIEPELDARTMADLLHELGDVPAERVRLFPPPGTVTFEQYVEISERRPGGKLYEWVDGTLVEKAVGYYESRIATFIIRALLNYVEEHDLGIISAPDGFMRILPDIARGPDVTFVAWASLPGGRPPAREDRVPSIVPDLVVEVLSESNRPGEMARKRREYFTAGVKQVWEIDPETRSAVVYTAEDQLAPVPANGTVSGGDILPGFTLSLQEIFDRADRQRPSA
jgi:Uma2 family endonuclease